MVLAAIDPVLGIILGGGLGAILTYLAAVRKMSGEIKTSDAEQLWNESRSIREWSADRIAQLTGTITSLETRVLGVEDRNKSLQDENEKLLQELVACRAAVTALTKQLSKSEDRVEVLEEEAKGG